MKNNIRPKTEPAILIVLPEIQNVAKPPRVKVTNNKILQLLNIYSTV